MIYLIIALGIIFLIWCFFRLTLSITFEYNGKPGLSVRVLLLKVRFLPKKEKKKKKLKGLSARAYKRKLNKIKKKEQRREKRRRWWDEQRKRRDERRKAKQKDKEKDQKPQPEETKKADFKLSDFVKMDDIFDVLDFFSSVSLKLIRNFGKRLRIKVNRFNITVASSDAAKSAIIYGTLTQSVAYLFKIIEGVTRFKCRSEDFSITTDFLTEKPKADISITFKVRLWHGIAPTVRFVFELIRFAVPKLAGKFNGQKIDSPKTSESNNNEHIKENA